MPLSLGHVASRFRPFFIQRGMKKGGLWFAAETHVVVEVEQVEPALDIFASLRQRADHFRKDLQRLRIAVGAATLLIIAPLFYLPRRVLVLSFLRDPLQNLAVAFPGC
jgi:hypothetical protein